MSDNDSSAGGGSEAGVTTLYRCRHCPGQEFTAAERDLHRQQHKKGKKKRGGSPPLTLFEPITVTNAPTGPRSPAKSPKRAKPGPKSSKRTSRKKYDRAVVKTSNDGG